MERDEGRRLGWWTRVPSVRSLALLVLVASWCAAVAWVNPWAAAAGVLGSGASVAGRWWRGETAWRRQYPRLGRDHPMVAEVTRVGEWFGLWRTPAVLLVDDMDSPAAAVDTAHPGAVVLVGPQMLAWLAQGQRRMVAAVLAHELGHLHRFHTAVGLAMRLLGVGAAGGMAILATLAAAQQQFGVGPGAPWPWWWLAVAAAVTAVAAGVADTAQNHVCELDADADASRVGFAAELAALLDVEERRVLRRGLFSHPHSRRRVAALRAGPGHRRRMPGSSRR